MSRVILFFLFIALAKSQEDFTLPEDFVIPDGVPQPRQGCFSQFLDLSVCLLGGDLVECGLCLAGASLSILTLDAQQCEDFGDWLCGNIDKCSDCNGCADLGECCRH